MKLTIYLGGALAVIVALAVMGSPSSTSEAKNPPPEVGAADSDCYAAWLGKQKNTGSHIKRDGQLDFRAIVETERQPIDPRWEHVKDDLAIELKVIRGWGLKLPETSNGVVTLINGEVSAIHERLFQGAFKPDPENTPEWDAISREQLWEKTRPRLPVVSGSLYIVGVARPLNEHYVSYYTLNVRITEGPLKGAIVHLRDHGHPVSRKEPYVAVYRIPKHIDVKWGELEFEVARVVWK